MPLMYVLLFPRGEDGWHDEILMQKDTNPNRYRHNSNVCQTKVTKLKFYALLRYKAHINIELYSTIIAVKYLYKYVYKGHDRATIQLVDNNGVVDEI